MNSSRFIHIFLYGRNSLNSNVDAFILAKMIIVFTDHHHNSTATQAVTSEAEQVCSTAGVLVYIHVESNACKTYRFIHDIYTCLHCMLYTYMPKVSFSFSLQLSLPSFQRVSFRVFLSPPLYFSFVLVKFHFTLHNQTFSFKPIMKVLGASLLLTDCPLDRLSIRSIMPQL